MNTITVDRAVLEQALQALKSLFNWQTDPDRGQRCSNAIAALEIALAQETEKEMEMEQEQEPVARVLQTVGQYPTGRFIAEVETVCRLRIGEYLYTHQSHLETEQEPVAWADQVSFDQAMQSGKGHDVWPEAGDYEARTGRKLRALYTHPSSHKENQEAYNYARSIAEAIWKKHYKDIAPHWKPHSDLLILLTQIDNMTATLRPAVL